MITVCRAAQRHQAGDRKKEVRLRLSHHGAGQNREETRTLVVLSEDLLAPRTRSERFSRSDAEILTYVREGTLIYEYMTGRSGVMYAGEFHRHTSRGGADNSEANAAWEHSARIFQLRLRPRASGAGHDDERKRFSTADRYCRLCLVASPSGREGSLLLLEDVMVYSAVLEPGYHLAHALAPGRSGWLHVVQGEVALGDLILSAGDGVGVTAERALSLTARGKAEILLLDLAGALSPGAGRGEAS